MVQVGLFGGEVTIPTALLALKMLTIEGSFVGTLSDSTRWSSWRSRAESLASRSSTQTWTWPG